MLSFYDALILVGRPRHQPYADRLNQWLKRYGVDVWQLATLPSSEDANTIDRVVSHAHNVLIVAEPDGYPNDMKALIEQAVAYHKRLFLIHPLGPGEESPGVMEEGDGGQGTAWLADQADQDGAWLADQDGAWLARMHPTGEWGGDGLVGEGRAVHRGNPGELADLERDHLQAWQALASLIEWDGRTPSDPWLIQLAVQVEGDEPSSSFLELLETLRDQEEVIYGHSHLLVQALRWASHSYADGDLLTEADLVQVNRWLKALAQHPGPTCQLTPLQRDLILASTQRTDEAIVTVLLAYADGDREMPLCPGGPTSVEALRDLLQAEGFSLWDPHFDCPPEANLEIALSRATEACDNYVILLSPQALGHALCLEGLLFALSMNKRIVPVLLSTVDADHLPEPLQGMPWVDLRGVRAPLADTNAGRQLVQLLRHEADYHRTHTQLLMAALRWERQQRHPSGLLSPQASRTYQRWLQESQPRPHHRPIYLQDLFVTESLRQVPPAMGNDSPRQTLAQLTEQMKTWLAQRIHR